MRHLDTSIGIEVRKRAFPDQGRIEVARVETDSGITHCGNEAIRLAQSPNRLQTLSSRDSHTKRNNIEAPDHFICLDAAMRPHGIDCSLANIKGIAAAIFSIPLPGSCPREVHP
jgi:hypothetical protein